MRAQGVFSDTGPFLKDIRGAALYTEDWLKWNETINPTIQYDSATVMAMARCCSATVNVTEMIAGNANWHKNWHEKGTNHWDDARAKGMSAQKNRR